MKNLNYYLSLPYKLEIIPDLDEGGYAASYPDLPGCITCAETLAEIKKNAEDAKIAWLKSALENNLTIQEPSEKKKKRSKPLKKRLSLSSSSY